MKIPSLDIMPMLTWAAWVSRDLAATWSLAMASVALLETLINLLFRGRARLDSRIVESGSLAWIVAAAGCFASLDRALLFPRAVVVVVLGLSALVWGLVIVLYRSRG